VKVSLAGLVAKEQRGVSPMAYPRARPAHTYLQWCAAVDSSLKVLRLPGRRLLLLLLLRVSVGSCHPVVQLGALCRLLAPTPLPPWPQAAFRIIIIIIII
jgi:hypothetical protein